ncbi:MAG: signal peptidase II [Actinomycetota bacterium]
MTDPHPSPARAYRLLPVTLVVASLVVLLDQVTKHWAVKSLSNGAPHHVIWTLQWNLSFNSGMAFSTGTGVGRIIGILAFGVVIAIVVGTRRNPSRLVAVAAGLVLGGAIGNLLDRLFRGDGFLNGAVVDFIDFQWFPIFNVADMGVNVGAALFIIWSLTGDRGKKAA